MMEDSIYLFSNSDVNNLKSPFTIHIVDGNKQKSGDEITKRYFAEMSRSILQYFTNQNTINNNIYHLQQVT